MGAEGDADAGVVAGLVGDSFGTERYAPSVTDVVEPVQISEGVSGDEAGWNDVPAEIE